MLESNKQYKQLCETGNHVLCSYRHEQHSMPTRHRHYRHTDTEFSGYTFQAIAFDPGMSFEEWFGPHVGPTAAVSTYRRAPPGGRNETFLKTLFTWQDSWIKPFKPFDDQHWPSFVALFFGYIPPYRGDWGLGLADW
eukprot:s1727_g18.t1